MGESQGSLSGLRGAELVGRLYAERKTGSLKVDSDPIQRAIYFRDGRILFCSSNAVEDQLGQILVAAGKITDAQLADIMGNLGPKKSIASALAESGLVTQRDIGDAARRKVEQIVAGVLRQEEGTFNFEDGVLPKGALDLKLTSEKLLVAALRFLEPAGFINRVLGSPLAVVAADGPTPEDSEWSRVHGALDGSSSIADVASVAGLSATDAGIVAAAMVLGGNARVVTSQIEDMNLPALAADDGPALVAEEASIPAAEEGEATLVAPMNLSMPAPDPEATMVAPASPGTRSGISASGIPDAPPPPRRARTQDLTAVREMLQQKTGPVKPEPAPPKLGAPPAAEEDSDERRYRVVLPPTLGGPIIGRKPWLPESKLMRGLLFAGVAVALGALGLIGWSVLDGSADQALHQPPPATPAAAIAAPSAAVPAATTATTAATTATTTATPPASAKPTPSPITAPSAAAPTSSPRATVAPVVSASPAAPRPTATPAPAPTRAAPPAPVVAAATPATPSATIVLDHLKKGAWAPAASESVKTLRANARRFTLQLAVACDPANIAKAVSADPSAELMLVPVTVSGRECFRLVRGVFGTQAAAAAAIPSLPAYYRAEGATPRAVPIGPLLR